MYGVFMLYNLFKRKILEKESLFGREQIGDIAWNIAATYLHYQ